MYLMADGENYESVIFEITACSGSQEAMLFAKELYNMYTNYFDKHGWDYEILVKDLTDIGGLRHANVTINDAETFGRLRYEADVDRVQSVPTTEKYGRVPTSTPSVAVIPRPVDIAIRLLERELKIETKRSSGAGGQHVNTTDFAVRIVHLPSGVAVESQSERSQIKNKEIDLKRLQSKLIQIAMESAEASVKGTRKAQLGILERNEKIRTHNFSQDRITGHRIKNGSVYNLKEFLQGGENLHNHIEKLAIENRKKNLQEMIDNFQRSIAELVNKEKKRGSKATVKVGPETSSKCAAKLMRRDESTSRAVISDIARILDPTMLLSRVAVTAKIVIHQLCKHDLPWDEESSESITNCWIFLRTNLSELNDPHMQRNAVFPSQ
uniref:Peptide chain release factor domain-containing protein n=1 Tax=Glossina pallidipes TaxID=7398 RepID=A0A1B0A4K3_GLOPL